MRYLFTKHYVHRHCTCCACVSVSKFLRNNNVINGCLAAVANDATPSFLNTKFKENKDFLIRNGLHMNPGYTSTLMDYGSIDGETGWIV